MLNLTEQLLVRLYCHINQYAIIMLTQTDSTILRYFIRNRESGRFSELGLKIKLLRVLASTKYTKK